MFSWNPSSTLNGPIMAWLTIPANIISLPFPYCFLLATSISELDEIHPLVHPSGPSTVTWDSSVKITLEKSIFIYFLAQFWHFEIFAFVMGGCLGYFFFYKSQFTKYSTLIVLLGFLNSSFFKKLSTGQKCFFFSDSLYKQKWVWSKQPCSFQGRNFLKPFPLFQVLNCYILNSLLVWWSLQSSFKIFKVDISSFNNFIFSFSAVIRSFPLSMFQLWIRLHSPLTNISLISILTSIN